MNLFKRIIVRYTSVSLMLRIFIGLVIVNVLLFTRKKKDEPTDDYAELCPDFIEGENE